MTISSRPPEAPHHGSDRRTALRLVAYWCVGIAKRCRINIPPREEWLIRTDTSPVTISRGGPRDRIELELALDADSLGLWALLKDPGLLMKKGKVKVNGEQTAIDRFHAQLGKTNYLGYYTALADFVTGCQYVFMNNGFWDEHQAHADSWLRMEDRPWRYCIGLVRHVLNGIDVTDKRIVDVGCGRGGTCSYLARYYAPRAIWGIDLCKGNIDFCTRVHQDANVRFVQADAEALPFKSATVDVVVNIESSHGYPNRRSFLESVRRVLKPGGILCWTDALSPSQVSAMAEDVAATGGTVLNAKDITREVMRGMELNRVPLEQMLLDLIDEESKNEWILRALVAGLDEMYRFFFDRMLCYRSCQISFPQR
jgi:O-methyltransferase